VHKGKGNFEKVHREISGCRNLVSIRPTNQVKKGRKKASLTKEKIRPQKAKPQYKGKQKAIVNPQSTITWEKSSGHQPRKRRQKKGGAGFDSERLLKGRPQKEV